MLQLDLQKYIGLICRVVWVAVGLLFVTELALFRTVIFNEQYNLDLSKLFYIGSSSFFVGSAAVVVFCLLFIGLVTLFKKNLIAFGLWILLCAGFVLLPNRFYNDSLDLILMIQCLAALIIYAVFRSTQSGSLRLFVVLFGLLSFIAVAGMTFVGCWWSGGGDMCRSIVSLYIPHALLLYLLFSYIAFPTYIYRAAVFFIVVLSSVYLVVAQGSAYNILYGVLVVLVYTSEQNKPQSQPSSVRSSWSYVFVVIAVLVVCLSGLVYVMLTRIQRHYLIPSNKLLSTVVSTVDLVPKRIDVNQNDWQPEYAKFFPHWNDFVYDVIVIGDPYDRAYYAKQLCVWSNDDLAHINMLGQNQVYEMFQCR